MDLGQWILIDPGARLMLTRSLPKQRTVFCCFKQISHDFQRNWSAAKGNQYVCLTYQNGEL